MRYVFVNDDMIRVIAWTVIERQENRIFYFEEDCESEFEQTGKFCVMISRCIVEVDQVIYFSFGSILELHYVHHQLNSSFHPSLSVCHRQIG